jgi:hypothetical protein
MLSDDNQRKTAFSVTENAVSKGRENRLFKAAWQ